MWQRTLLTTLTTCTAKPGTIPRSFSRIAARQVFGAIKKAEIGSIPEPGFAFEAVPEDINTYSDGGYLNPSSHDFGIATAAAWKPHPEGLARDATPVEKAHGECREKDDGIESMIMLQDPIGSSTRSELRGLIAAVAGPCTAHVGIDSQACMNKAQQIIAIAQKAYYILGEATMHQGMRRQRLEQEGRRLLEAPIPTPWQLVRDGDLWRIYWKALIAKGVHAVRLTKLKGHTTYDDVKKETITAEHRHGNMRADAICNDGYGVVQGAQNLTQWYQARHAEYCRFIMRVQRLILHMMKAEKEAREHKANMAHPVLHKGPAKLAITRCLSYGLASAARRLRLRPLPLSQYAFSSYHDQLRSVYRFLSHYHYEQVDVHQSGLSWIEFCASFENHGLTIEKGGAILQKIRYGCSSTDSNKWSGSSLTTVHTNSTSACSVHPVPVGPGSLR